MYLRKFEELSRYLTVNGSNRDDICRFLNFEIFNYLECRGVYFAQLKQEGSLQPVADFGFTKGVVDTWGSFPLTFDIPISAAVRRNACIYVDSPDDLYSNFPVMKQVEKLDHEWNSITAIPINAFGVYSVTAYGKPKKDADHERFLRTVGQFASVAISKCHLIEQIQGQRVRVSFKSIGKQELTVRQNMIRDLILRGLTNIQIAAEIGYSESLVRQETISIYAALNVKGRKELLQIGA